MFRNHMSRGEKILVACVILAFGLVLILTVLTIAMNSAASGTLYSAPPFALTSLLSDDTETNTVSLGDYVLPAFIGISPEPEGIGISIGDNIIRELYTMLSPCLADGLMTEPDEDTAVNWEMAAKSKRAVYIRYHSALPVMVLQGAAASLVSGTESVTEAEVLPARELFILLPDAQYGDCQILLRDADGTVWRYICGGRLEYPTLDTVMDFTEHFSGSFFRFTLGISSSGETEPVFLERMRVRNVLMTDEIAVMIQENQMNHIKTLLRQFDFNPDKLSTHEEADGTLVTVESHGLFRMEKDRLVYTAGTDGGIMLENFIGYKEAYTPLDSIRAACTMISNLRSMHLYYLGGDGELILTELSFAEGQLQIGFRYAFDNLLLDGCGPALVVQVKDGRVMLADIYIISLRSIGDFASCYQENSVWTDAAEEGMVYSDATLAYPVDFSGKGVFPVWVLYRKP